VAIRDYALTPFFRTSGTTRRLSMRWRPWIRHRAESTERVLTYGCILTVTPNVVFKGRIIRNSRSIPIATVSTLA